MLRPPMCLAACLAAAAAVTAAAAITADRAPVQSLSARATAPAITAAVPAHAQSLSARAAAPAITAAVLAHAQSLSARDATPAITAAVPAHAQSRSARAIASAARSRRLVGGTEADVKTAPWTAALHHRRRHLCGGSIIAAQWVLTSARCVHNAPAALSVRVGSSLRGSDGQVVEAKAITAHKDYQFWSWDNDIAVIELGSEIEFNENAKVVPLAAKLPDFGTELVMSGWGLQGLRGAASWKLRTAKLQLYDRDQCNAKYNVALTDRMLCAGAKGVDACVGDAGGALVHVAADPNESEQVGIILWDHDCADPRHYETDYRMPYTSVPDLREWVKETTGAIER